MITLQILNTLALYTESPEINLYKRVYIFADLWGDMIYLMKQQNNLMKQQYNLIDHLISHKFIILQKKDDYKFIIHKKKALPVNKYFFYYYYYRRC